MTFSRAFAKLYVYYAIAAVMLIGLTSANSSKEPSADCPSLCTCSIVMGKNLTNCQERGLATMPDAIAKGTNFLDLSGNEMAVINDEQFASLGLFSLETIVLESSGVQQIRENAFVGLKWLKELDLSNNSIVSVDRFVFSDNKMLEMVNFSGNPIHTLVSFQFTALPMLKTLDFSNCALKIVQREAFSNLLSLENLSLRNNSLGTLPAGLFAWLKNLSSLDLHENPWRCDCDIQSLAVLLMIRRLYTHDLSCRYDADNATNLWQRMEIVRVECALSIENSVKESLMNGLPKRLHETQRFSIMDTSKKLFSSHSVETSFLPVALIAVTMTVSFLCLISCYRKCRKSSPPWPTKSDRKSDDDDFESRACYSNFDEDCSDISLTIEL